MNDTQEYILQKSIDNLIKMIDKLNKDLEKVSKEADQYREEADYYRTMYEKYKQMYIDLDLDPSISNLLAVLSKVEKEIQWTIHKNTSYKSL